MKKIIYSIASAFGLAAPFIVGAQGQIPRYNPLSNITNVPQFIETIQKFANFVGMVLMGIAVIMILFAAFNFLTAAGNEDKIKSARNYLIFALVGVAVALLAFALPAVIGPLLGGT